MEYQSSETCHEKSGRYIKTCEQRNQNGSAEHCEGVLDAENKHLGDAELAGIKNAFFEVSFAHFCVLLFKIQVCKRSAEAKKISINCS